MIGRLLATARRRGITRGLLGDSTGWLLLGALAWGLRAMRLIVRPPAPARGRKVRLRQGERLAIRHRPPRPPARR